MRQKGIRTAVAGAILVTLVISAGPAMAGGRLPSSRPESPIASFWARLEGQLSGWAGRLTASWNLSGDSGLPAKTSSSRSGTGTAATTTSPNSDLDRGSAIDPLGLN